MGKYTIVISGEGKHHSKDDQQTDANKVALDFVSWLKKEGHIVHSAIFNHADNTKTDDLHAMTEPVIAVDPTPLPMKIFKIEAEGDEVYVQAVHEESAIFIMSDAMGAIPRDLLTVTEVPELPEGVELLNPTADDEASEVEGQGTSG